jgi:biotin synthase
MVVNQILESVRDGNVLNKKDAIALLNIKNNSDDFYKLLSLANEMTRREYKNQGFIFAQIGLNAEPCSVDCKFCSMSKSNYVMDSIWKKDIDTVLSEAEAFFESGINDLFLMTTADYPINEFLDIAKRIKAIIPDGVRFVANIGDFDYVTALKMKEAGFTGAYHIRRLKEGIDTTITPELRINTIESIIRAGLELYYCVEPIGPEHSYEEIAEEMIRARDYHIGAMAVMRRTPVIGTPLYENGQISSVELTKVAAVTRLVTQPYRSLNAHETTQMSLIGGVNQLYAEVGANPRDNNSNTEKSRGYTVERIKQLLRDAEYEV